LKCKPDIVITEKGVSDIAQHFLMKGGNITIIRRIRKTDNNRIARVTGATIVNRPEEIQETDLGTKCGLFEVRKIGDDYFSFFEQCQEPKACSIVLRGASKDVLNEMERNLHDALAVARNVMITPKIVPGGGAMELELSKRLLEKSKEIEGLQQLPYKAVAYALEIIPKTLAQNCGADVVRIITSLRAKHASEGPDGMFLGLDGNAGTIADMRTINVWEPVLVKLQTFKTAVESSCMLLRIDDVVSGIKKKKEQARAPAPQAGGPPGEGGPEETFGDARDG
jgi:T-complex protein 1 subunit gamma